MQIRHISLDLWMTLIRSNPGYKTKRAELLADFFSIADVAETERTIREVDLMANHINETTGGNLDALELYLLVLYRLKADVKKITKDDLLAFYAKTEILFTGLPPVPMDDSVEEAFKMLQERNITMSILSNTGFVRGNLLQKFFEQKGWSSYFSFSIFSDETGHSKPSSRMFGDVWKAVKQHYPPETGIFKKHVLHVGDNRVADYGGAANFGFSAALFRVEGPPLYDQIKQALHDAVIFTS